MSWKDRLQRASFRAVPFFVESHDFSSGRRGAVHEYPQRELPTVQDMGARARRFRLVGYVLGADYMQRRDALITALERSGSGGTLVHPYFGVRGVFALDFTVRESTREGGIATFEMEFVQVDPTPTPLRPRPVTGPADAAAAQAVLVAQADAEALLTGEGPESVRDASAGEARTLGAKLSALDVFSGPARSVSVLKARTINLITRASQLATAPAQLAGDVLSAIDSVQAAALNALGAFEAYATLSAHARSVFVGLGPIAKAQNTNALVLTGVIHLGSIAGALRAGARVKWQHHDQALDALARLRALIEAAMEEAPPRMFTELQNLLGVAAASMPPPNETLPRTTTFTPARTQPSLVLAYDLYDEPERGHEISERNRLAHPMFIPGGQALEVLVDT